jgi:hypothetical protein
MTPDMRVYVAIGIVAIVVIIIIIIISKCMEAERQRIIMERREAERYRRERLKKIDKEASVALNAAQRATHSCIAMCEAVSLAAKLRSDCGLSEELKKCQRGPNEETLIWKARETALKRLTIGHQLSAEGVLLTTDPRYQVLRGYFHAAEAACRVCKPRAGRDGCPAYRYMQKIELM